MITIVAQNPFFDAFASSDLLGKAIFIALFSLSVITWIVILYKSKQANEALKKSKAFKETFKKHSQSPLTFSSSQGSTNNPFYSLHSTLKKHTVNLLNKNRHFQGKEQSSSYLSPVDIDFVETHLLTEVNTQTKNLEKNLYILSTVVTLAPFLGILGTVWGILSTFSEMQAASMSNANQTMLHGLSLAMATTVLGLIDAIPALVGYNWLKNKIHNFSTEMLGFANELISSVELYYRKVDISS